MARFVTPHADPFTFLTIRFVLSVTVFALIAMAFGVSWPRKVRDYVVAIATGAYSRVLSGRCGRSGTDCLPASRLS